MAIEQSLEEYQERLRLLIDAALHHYERKHNQAASLRRLAASIGKPGAFNTLYRWQKGEFRQPIRPSSFSLLCAIDPKGRNPIQLVAYLEGVAESDLSGALLQELSAALYIENLRLKKKQAEMFRLVAT